MIVAVAFAEFPVIRLTSGQASVSGSMFWIIIEPSAVFRPTSYILCVFWHLLSRKCSNLNPYYSLHSPRNFLQRTGQFRSSINPQLSCKPRRGFSYPAQSSQRKMQTWTWQLHSPFFLSCNYSSKSHNSKPFSYKHTISPVTATHCLPLSLMSLIRIFKALFLGGTEEHV